MAAYGGDTRVKKLEGGREMVGVLYESGEWSDFKLACELEAALAECDEGGAERAQKSFAAASDDGAGAVAKGGVVLVNMVAEDCIERALQCDLLVSRVFASAPFRNHAKAHANMEKLVEALRGTDIRMINAPRAHFFEIDKRRAAWAMAQGGVLVPRVFACGAPQKLAELASEWEYPCIVKPNCGGRSTCTAIVHDKNEAYAFLATLACAAAAEGECFAVFPRSLDKGGSLSSEKVSEMDFIVEEYLRPKSGFLTRLELVNGELLFAVKRSVAENGLSSYHFGSTYEMYPDCPSAVVAMVEHAAALLAIRYGSFDVIECERGAFVIDANSVSNVSEDCTEMFGIDLMHEYARSIVACKQYSILGERCDE